MGVPPLPGLETEPQTVLGATPSPAYGSHCSIDVSPASKRWKLTPSDKQDCNRSSPPKSPDLPTPPDTPSQSEGDDGKFDYRFYYNYLNHDTLAKSGVSINTAFRVRQCKEEILFLFSNTVQFCHHQMTCLSQKVKLHGFHGSFDVRKTYTSS